jgi:hypothetical protein
MQWPCPTGVYSATEECQLFFFFFLLVRARGKERRLLYHFRLSFNFNYHERQKPHRLQLHDLCSRCNMPVLTRVKISCHYFSFWLIYFEELYTTTTADHACELYMAQKSTFNPLNLWVWSIHFCLSHARLWSHMAKNLRWHRCWAWVAKDIFIWAHGCRYSLRIECRMLRVG